MASQKQTTKDMTVGSPSRLILGFAIPMLLGMIFQHFYNMVDTVVVGKCISVEALAGVGSTGSISFFVIGFSSGLASGCAIPVSQAFGAKDYDSLRKYVGNTIWASLLVIVPLTVVVSAFCRPLLELLQTPEDAFHYAYVYILILFLGIPITYAYNILAAMIRALGDSRTPVYFVMIASLVNVVLDILFVLVFSMGVEGPAIATLLSQGVSVVLCFVYIRKRLPILQMQKEDFTLEWRRVRHLISMGVPMGLQYSITAIGSLVLQSSVNMLGSASMAAKAAGDKIYAFFACPLDAIAITMATYAGQNVGANKLDRLGRGLRDAMFISAGYSVIAFAVLAFFGKPLSLLFIEKGQESILEETYLLVFVYAATYVLLSFVNNFRLTIQGMGFSTFSIFSGLSEMVARMLIGIVFVPRFGYIAACFAGPLAWVFATAFLIPAFFYCRKRLYRRLKNDNTLLI